MITPTSIAADVAAIRKQAPLIHNITNYVAMNNSANALLALGASPIMAHAVEEVRTMVDLASALVINIGTLSTKWVEAMITAGEEAREKGKPIVLDPVGAGATPYRTEAALTLIELCRPAIIRGNASEIMTLAQEVVDSGQTKGVDSLATSSEALDAAVHLAIRTSAVVIVSGAEDFITDGHHILSVKNGSPLMAKVTGMGCTASALTGAFAAVNANYLLAGAHAMAVMGIAGELAARTAQGPGTLQLYFIDTLYQLTEEMIRSTWTA